VSNFLLWQLAYSELVFDEVLWPDFRRTHLFAACATSSAASAATAGSHDGHRAHTGPRPGRAGARRRGWACGSSPGGWSGLIVYAGVVLAWHAGFTAAAPFVVIPAVLVVMIGAGNLVSGRRPGRAAPRFNRPDLDPVPSDGPGRLRDRSGGRGPGRHRVRGARHGPMTQFRDRGVVLRTIRSARRTGS